MTREQLFEALVESGAVTQEQFDAAEARKEAVEIGVEGVLVARGVLKDEQLGQMIALWFGVPFVNLRTQELRTKIARMVPESFARTHELIPVSQTEKKVVIATSSPDDVITRSLLEKLLRKEVVFSYATPKDIRAHMHMYQKDPRHAFTSILERELKTGKPIDTRTVDLVANIIDCAYQMGSSDIHIEPEDDYTVVRYRQDGILHDVAELPTSAHEHVVTRLKVLARLATDEHRKAQDGKISHKTAWGDDVEIRVSILPTTHREKAVLRLLSDKARTFSLADLGLSTDDFKKVSDVIHKPWGAILITGPTGSGKTTTLYAMLRALNQREVNVITIEDPVEYDIEGVSQTQVNEKVGLSFASGLRSIVRQDPDIIMVGEIRDKETAGIAVNAAMTGHLVLSTLHTNDAATAFPRLVDMDVEGFLIASTVNVVVAQRLVRKTCMSCIGSVEMGEARRQLIERIPKVKEFLLDLTGQTTLEKLRLFEGKGCHVCSQSGFHGRVGIFEVLMVSEKIREAIMDKRNADEIHQIATEEGMTNMLYDGLRKVVTGQTTLEEVLRVTRD